MHNVLIFSIRPLMSLDPKYKYGRSADVLCLSHFSPQIVKVIIIARAWAFGIG